MRKVAIEPAIGHLWALLPARSGALGDRPGPGAGARVAVRSRPDTGRMSTPAGFLSRAAILASVLLMASCGSGPADDGGGGSDAQSAETVTYFLVAEWPGEEVHGDSYVLPLTRAEDIAHARALISQGPQAAGRPVAVSKIRLGADGINRDLRAPGQPPWSWHVTEFMGFGDSSVEILDGWPGWVEQDPEGWMANTPPDEQSSDDEGSIGFWTYTVVEELPGSPDGTNVAPNATVRADARPQ